MDVKKDIFQKAKHVLSYTKNAFDSERKSDISESLKYLGLWSFILSLLSTILQVTIGKYFVKSFFKGFLGEIPADIQTELFNYTIFGIIKSIFTNWIGIFVLLIILILWIHLWVFIFGGRLGLENTFKSVVYGFTPLYIIGWIPILGLIGLFWSLYLTIIGISRLQKIPKGKSTLAIIISLVFPLILVLLLALYVFVNLIPNLSI